MEGSELIPGKWYEFYFAGIKTKGEYVGITNSSRLKHRFYGKKFSIYLIDAEMVIGECEPQKIDWTA